MNEASFRLEKNFHQKVTIIRTCQMTPIGNQIKFIVYAQNITEEILKR